MENLYDSMLQAEPNRLRGEESQRTGNEYEELVILYILRNFRQFSKTGYIKRVRIRNLEDLDIIDSNNRLHLFQIKSKTNNWTPREQRLRKFLLRYFDRLKKFGFDPAEVKHYFISNKGGQIFTDIKERKEPNYIVFSDNEQKTKYFRGLKILIKRVKDIFIYSEFFKSRGKFNDFLKNSWGEKKWYSFIEFIYSVCYDADLSQYQDRTPLKENDTLILNIMNVNYPKSFFRYNLTGDELLIRKYPSARRQYILDTLKTENNKGYSSFDIISDYVFTFTKIRSSHPLSRFIILESEHQISETEFLTQYKRQDLTRFLNRWIHSLCSVKKLQYDYKRYRFFFTNDDELSILKPGSIKPRSLVKHFLKAKPPHWLNLAIDMYFWEINGNYFLRFIPMLTFSRDGTHLFEGDELKQLEEKYYRKPTYSRNSNIEDELEFWEWFVKECEDFSEDRKFIDREAITLGTFIKVNDFPFKPAREDQERKIMKKGGTILRRINKAIKRDSIGQKILSFPNKGENNRS